MAIKYPDRTLAYTSSTGTGDLELGSSPTGYQAFSAGMSDGDTTTVLIVNDPNLSTQWELTWATFNDLATDTITRGTLIASSTGSRIDFDAGQKSIYVQLSSDFFSRFSRLTLVEIAQLENINGTAIGEPQWGYVGGADQALKTTDTAQFDSLGVGVSSPGAKAQIYTATSGETSLTVNQADASANHTVSLFTSARASGTGATKLMLLASGGGADTEFAFDCAGNANADGSFTGGGADFAEWREMADGNPDGEDLAGISVVFVGSKLRICEPGEAPDGVISARPTIVGGGDVNGWTKKYLKDDFGRYLLEPYSVVHWLEKKEESLVRHSYPTDEVPSGIEVPETAVEVTEIDGVPLTRRILNPDFDEEVKYVPREERPEWVCIARAGIVPVRKGQPVKGSWKFLREISEYVDEYWI